MDVVTLGPPSITAFESCMKSKVGVSAGVGRYELFPESSKELVIVSSRIETVRAAMSHYT